MDQKLTIEKRFYVNILNIYDNKFLLENYLKKLRINQKEILKNL